MNNQTRRVIGKYNLEGCVSIVAVSGGVDSVVLLDILAGTVKSENIIVAHINHGLRKESTKEAIFVRGLAENYGLKYVEKSLDLTTKDEATARNKRYTWLRSQANKNRAKYIITAHHLDDQIETILLRITRGVGPIDVWGMKENEGDILRPLLNFTKKEIIAYAKARRLRWVEDKSNADIRYSRNRVRQNVIPELSKINSALPKTMQNEICLGQEASDYFTKQIQKVEKRLVTDGRIELSKLGSLHPFVAKEIIRRQLQTYMGKTDIYQKNVDTVYGLLDKNGSKETKLGKLVIKKTYKHLIFGYTKPRIIRIARLIPNERLDFNGFILQARIGSSQPKKNNILLPLSFSANLKVRTWRAGDKIEATFGTKKIQDVFTDAKIELADRQKWPIVLHEKKIIWVPGLVASKYAKKSKSNLIIEVK